MKNKAIQAWLRLRHREKVSLYVPETSQYVTKVVITRQSRSGKTVFSTLNGQGDDLLEALIQALGRSKTQFRQVADVLGAFAEAQQQEGQDHEAITA